MREKECVQPKNLAYWGIVSPEIFSILECVCLHNSVMELVGVA